MLLNDLVSLRWFPSDAAVIAVEQRRCGNRWIVRAELPGIDPARDVDVSICSGRLRLVAVRRPDACGNGHTQFRYGTFRRELQMPPGAHEPIAVSCQDGILEVVIGCDPLQGPFEGP